MKSIALLLFSAAAFAQQQNRGLTPEWDIGKAITEISDYAKRLLPMIDQIDPKPWIEKGASYAYERQVESAKTQTKAVADAAQSLARSPAKLSAAIELTYRLHSLESVMGSLADGMRRYHNPAMAELVMGVLTENGANRDRLQQYVVDLAVDKESEFSVADREAQRCRGYLSRQAPEPPSQGTSRKK